MNNGAKWIREQLWDLMWARGALSLLALAIFLTAARHQDATLAVIAAVMLFLNGYSTGKAIRNYRLFKD